jgi:hypothetical protein
MAPQSQAAAASSLEMPQPRWRRAVGQVGHWSLPCLVFLGALAAASLLIRGVNADDPGDPIIQAKLAAYTPRKDEFDVLFFGSSRILCSVVPAVFDAEMARAGHPVTSFNFGVSAMNAHETDAFMQRVLANPPARLRFVVVELGLWTSGIYPGNYFSKRALAWHSWPETLAALHTTWHVGGGFDRKLDRTRMHLLHLAGHYANLGDGSRWLQALSGLAPPPDPEEMAAATVEDGYMAVENGPGHMVLNPRGVPVKVADPAPIYRERIAQLRRSPARRCNETALEQQIAQIRALGARPVHLIPMTFTGNPTYDQMSQQGRLPLLLRFNDPDQYPELYDPQFHRDFEHLNRRGAELFSRLLAERLVERLEQARDR